MLGTLRYSDVDRLLRDTRDLSHSNRTAALSYLVRKLGVDELFRAYIMQEFDKDSALDLDEGEVELACSYVNGISRLIDSSFAERMQ